MIYICNLELLLVLNNQYTVHVFALAVSGMCVNNSIPMCKDLGYSSVYMPYNQSKTIEEVGLELHQFWPIVEVS